MQPDNPSALNHQHRSSPSGTLRAWVPSHDVQFYQSEEFLVTAVANYLVDGVRSGQPIIVIATGAHRKAFADRMRSMGVDPDDLVHARDAIWLDAAETLSAFMEGSRPNPELFDATVGNVFEKIVANRKYVMVRAYGEMVDLLWQEGKAEGAIALEELWNALAAKYAFSMLCAYANSSLLADANPHGLERICGVHERVLPSEPESS